MDLKFQESTFFKIIFSIKLVLFVLCFSAIIYISSTPLKADDSYAWITIDSSSLEKIPNYSKSFMDVSKTIDNISLIEVEEGFIPMLSMQMHQKLNVCGGFVRHESKEEALKYLNSKSHLKNFNLNEYTISESDYVNSIIGMVKENNIYNTIEKLSSYHNRYYKSETGVEALEWIHQKWSELVKSRTDVKVEFVKHQRWKQPSVKLTFFGNELSSQNVVVGGHADSIAGYFSPSFNRAPGADDNASGIATITEVIRVLVENNFVPQRTVTFMAYAAEEVGLLGSKEIAQNYRDTDKDVVGVLQLDMTNYKGSAKDIYLVSDNTDDKLNKFLGKLIDEYLKVKWGYTRCGYACSDHASWHSKNYPAAFPFEASKRGMNPKIHTKRDLLDVSDHSAEHAVIFSKLAISFVIELSKVSKL